MNATKQDTNKKFRSVRWKRKFKIVYYTKQSKPFKPLTNKLLTNFGDKEATPFQYKISTNKQVAKEL